MILSSMSPELDSHVILLNCISPGLNQTARASLMCSLKALRGAEKAGSCLMTAMRSPRSWTRKPMPAEGAGLGQNIFQEWKPANAYTGRSIRIHYYYCIISCTNGTYPLQAVPREEGAAHTWVELTSLASRPLDTMRHQVQGHLHERD